MQNVVDTVVHNQAASSCLGGLTVLRERLEHKSMMGRIMVGNEMLWVAPCSRYHALLLRDEGKT